jgi:hypothetical protein
VLQKTYLDKKTEKFFIDPKGFSKAVMHKLLSDDAELFKRRNFNIFVILSF